MGSAPPLPRDRDRPGQFTVDGPFDARTGRIWATDPGTGEPLGQIDLGTGSASAAAQSDVDATFFAMVADMAGAPRELPDTDTGEIAGRVTQSLYGRRTWRGQTSSPLLFAGQYEDTESGWAYNRFRFYDPVAGVYGAQDPLGLRPKTVTAQGYVDHAALWADIFGLKGHQVTIKELEDLGVNTKDRQRVADYLNHEGNFATGTMPTEVYAYSHADGTMKYVGTANDLERRAAEHGNRFGSRMKPRRFEHSNYSPEVDELNRHRAHAVEQHFISSVGKGDGQPLVNTANSIAQDRDIAAGVEIWAQAFLAKAT